MARPQIRTKRHHSLLHLVAERDHVRRSARLVLPLDRANTTLRESRQELLEVLQHKFSHSEDLAHLLSQMMFEYLFAQIALSLLGTLDGVVLEPK